MHFPEGEKLQKKFAGDASAGRPEASPGGAMHFLKIFKKKASRLQMEPRCTSSAGASRRSLDATPREPGVVCPGGACICPKGEKLRASPDGSPPIGGKGKLAGGGMYKI